MSYTPAQWLLVFFSYCVIGWLWESGYVSLKRREWVNRGFLYGPWLPIYGFGAVIILLCTRKFSSIPLIFLAGMAGATLLEYLTGWLMEKLFHMRYWDYSHIPLNINGYVCLSVSLAWGGFSVLLVKGIHPLIDRGVRLLTGNWAYYVSMALAVLFTVDAVKSVQAVLDVKQLLEKLTQSSNTLARISQRLNDGSEYFRRLKENLDQSVKRAKEGVTTQKLDKISEHVSRKSRMVYLLTGKTEQFLDEIDGKLASARTDGEKERLLKSRKSLVELLELLNKAEVGLQERKSADIRKAVSILRRNPTAVSRRYPAAFTEISNLVEQFREKRGK